MKSNQTLFRHILGNTLLASFANAFIWFALTFWAYIETRSVLTTSLIGGAYLVLVMGSGIIFGSIVDHHKKKTVMVGSTLVSLGFYLIAYTLYLSQDPSTWTTIASPLLWVLILLIMIGAVIGNIRMIALSTIVTLLFEENVRDKANGQVGVANGLLFTVVSVFSGLTIGQLGMGWAMVLTIAASLISIVHIIFLSFPHEPLHDEVDPSGEKKKKDIDLRGTIAMVTSIGGLWGMIFFSMWNNFLGGVFMSLMDAYGLSLVSVEVWGFVLAITSTGFIIGGMLVARWGLGKNPVRTLLWMSVAMWIICIFFTSVPSIILTGVGFFCFMMLGPVAEACEQTIFQKVVPFERQGRVFGFSQSIEQTASPLTAFLIGPIAEFFVIPFMASTTGVSIFGGWFGTTPDRAIALIFSLAGIIGLIVALLAFQSRSYRLLSQGAKKSDA